MYVFRPKGVYMGDILKEMEVDADDSMLDEVLEFLEQKMPQVFLILPSLPYSTVARKVRALLSAIQR